MFVVTIAPTYFVSLTVPAVRKLVSHTEDGK